jgi:signal peptidase I
VSGVPRSEEVSEPEELSEAGTLSDADEPSDVEDPREPGRGRGEAVFAVAREVALVLVIALGLSLLIKTFVLQAFSIPSPSMESLLTRGDRVVVSKLTPGPFDLRRGDPVVFSDPANWLSPTERPAEGPVREKLRSALVFVGLLPSASEDHLIKRVIGLPGDRVACCDPKGRLTINGVGVDEPYLFPGDDPSDVPFSVTVPAGHLWVMGDHRSVSQDSRAHRSEPGHGFVPIDDVVGKALARVWPLDRAARIRNPTATFDPVPDP